MTVGQRQVSDADLMIQAMMIKHPQEEEAKMITLIDKHKSGSNNRKQNRNTVAIFSNHKSGSSNTSNKHYIIKSPGHRLSSGLKEEESDEQVLNIFPQFQQQLKNVTTANKKVKHPTTRILGDDYSSYK